MIMSISGSQPRILIGGTLRIYIRVLQTHLLHQHCSYDAYDLLFGGLPRMRGGLCLGMSMSDLVEKQGTSQVPQYNDAIRNARHRRPAHMSGMIKQTDVSITSPEHVISSIYKTSIKTWVSILSLIVIFLQSRVHLGDIWNGEYSSEKDQS
jgi:hypothetical protein